MIKSLSPLLCLLLLTAPSAFADSNVAADAPATGADSDAETVRGVEGKVTEQDEPMPEAVIYAYELASDDLIRVTTDALGRFLFEGLPAGMYKLVAFKPGFQPAVELLLRRRPDDHQFVRLELQPRPETEERPAEQADFWTVRGRVPMDVLRQIEIADLAQQASSQGVEIDRAALFEAEMKAFSGVESLGPTFGEAQLTAADFGVRAALGEMGVGIDGSFRQLSPSSQGSPLDGQVKSVAVHFDPSDTQKLRFATSNSELTTENAASVDLDHYRLDWSGRTGSHGSTRVSASYMQETNYFLGGTLRPMSIPGSSETWGLEGSYTGRLTDRTSLEAGLVYRQSSLDGLAGPDENLGLFTVAGSQIEPRIFVEYGLYSSIRDGSLSLVPHGGVVVRLGDRWSAQTSVSRRVEAEEDDLLLHTHRSAFYGDSTSCREVGETCFEVTLAREEGEESFSIGALHREFSETLSLYFSADFFDRLESVFLVEGDRLPELQLSVVRRIAPKVLAKLESNFASGGGGIFYATNSSSYENEVRYLVTSLDTRFQQTATGVFLAFHHLEQGFHPVESEVESPARVELQRLQLMLTQDLNVLADLASKWAVNLNMELSRGATPYALTADDQTYRKLTGGFSVSF